MAEETMQEVQIKNEKSGKITFNNDVIATIAGLSTVEVDGVAGMSGGFTSGVAELLGRKNMTKGVKVEIGTEEASVDLYVVMEYGTPIQKAAYDAQESVRKAIETMTNLHVVRVDVHVQGVSFEKENNALNAGAKKALAEDKKETPLVEAPESEEKAAEDSAEVPEEEGKEN